MIAFFSILLVSLKAKQRNPNAVMERFMDKCYITGEINPCLAD